MQRQRKHSANVLLMCSSPHDAITKVKEQRTMLEKRKQVMEHKDTEVTRHYSHPLVGDGIP